MLSSKATEEGDHGTPEESGAPVRRGTAHAFGLGPGQRASRPHRRAPPGTRAFAALREEIEATWEFPTTQGVVTITPEDHNGLDERARVIVRVDGGTWRLME